MQPRVHSIPYLSGIAARNAELSPDGNWVAYITMDWKLWRSRPDGSSRLQLTFPPLAAARPHWSPDSKKIAFRGDLIGSNKIYLISPEGGSPEPVTSEPYVDYPCWSADGKSLIYTWDTRIPFSDKNLIAQVDLKSRKVSALPGSQGMNAESFSPDGRYMAAYTTDHTKLMLFQVRNH